MIRDAKHELAITGFLKLEKPHVHVCSVMVDFVIPPQNQGHR